MKNAIVLVSLIILILVSASAAGYPQTNTNEWCHRTNHIPDHIWLELDVGDHVTICYTDSNDAELVRPIIEEVLALNRDKYGIHTLAEPDLHVDPIHLNIHFVDGIRRWRLNRLVPWDGEVKGIHYPSPSHPTMQNHNHRKSLAEMIFWLRPIPWQVTENAPHWFVRDLGLYDAMFHISTHNSAQEFRSVVERLERRGSSIALSRELLRDNQPILSVSRSGLGVIVLKYFADRFGEDLHSRLSSFGPDSSFYEVLHSELKAAGTTLNAEFMNMEQWLLECNKYRVCDTPSAPSEELKYEDIAEGAATDNVIRLLELLLEFLKDEED